MKELDIVEIINPTSQDFTWNYNGEPYTIKAKEKRSFVKAVGYHLAKHLSTKMITSEAAKEMTDRDKENPNARIHFKIAQLEVNDTSERRIALYKILRDENLVVDLIQSYPFKGFIGEMEEYKKFVEDSKKPQKEVVNNL